MKKFFLTALILVVVLVGFTPAGKEEISINLFYTKNYPGDTWSNHRTGLLWTLSYLGAVLPKDSFDAAIHWQDSTTFNLRLPGLGFNSAAIKALTRLTDSLKHCVAYQKYNKLDLGAFVSLTIGSSPNYYAITRMPGTLAEFYAMHHFNAYSIFPVSNSGVAKHHRTLKYQASSADATDWAFVAEDGRASDFNPGKPEVYEVYDIMQNGQLRFGVYDKKGNLINGSPASLSKAGKPAKCMWCHEISILPLYTKNDSVSGYKTPAQFNADMAALMDKLKLYRQALKSDIDFNNTQDHTRMELLYISYMQPGTDRLAQEWHMPGEEAAEVIKRLKKVKHEEFIFLGELINRSELKNNLPLPKNIRESGEHDPDFFGQ